MSNIPSVINAQEFYTCATETARRLESEAMDRHRNTVYTYTNNCIIGAELDGETQVNIFPPSDMVRFAGLRVVEKLIEEYAVEGGWDVSHAAEQWWILRPQTK